jgi:hypothetical protein
MDTDEAGLHTSVSTKPGPSDPDPVGAESKTPQRHQHLSHLNFWLIILTINVCFFLALVETVIRSVRAKSITLTQPQSIVSTALPTIINELHNGQFIWVGSAYNLSSTAFMPTIGGLSEVRCPFSSSESNSQHV